MALIIRVFFMYTDNNLHEYPFSATFYHLGVDESKPLDQQVEEKIVSFESKCDMSDRNSNLDNSSFTLYMPIDKKKGYVEVAIGETVEVETFGLVQRGRVLVVFPSTLNGVSVVCTRI